MFVIGVVGIREGGGARLDAKSDRSLRTARPALKISKTGLEVCLGKYSPFVTPAKFCVKF